MFETLGLVVTYVGGTLCLFTVFFGLLIISNEQDPNHVKVRCCEGCGNKLKNDNNNDCDYCSQISL